MRSVVLIIIALIIGIAFALDLTAGNDNASPDAQSAARDFEVVHDVDLTEVVQ